MKRILLSAVATLALASPGLAQSVTINSSTNNSQGVVNALTSSTFFPADTAGNASSATRSVDKLNFADGTVFTQTNFDQWRGGSFTRVERVDPNSTSNTAASFQVGHYAWTDEIPGESGTSGNLFVGNPDTPGGLTNGSLAGVFGAPQNLASILDGEDSYAARFTTSYDVANDPTDPGENITTSGAGVYYAFDLNLGGAYVDSTAQDIDLVVLERGKNSKVRVAALDIDGNVITGTETVIDFTVAGLDTLFPINTSEIGGNQNVAGIGVNFNNSLIAKTRFYGFRLQYDNLGGESMQGPDIVAVGAATAVPEPATFAQAAMGALGASIMGLTVVRRRRRVAA